MYFLSVLGSKKNINVKQKRGLRSAINNYWMRLSRISWFVSGEQINYCNNWSMRHGQITIFCINRVQLSFSQWVCFFNEYLAFCHFYTKLIARRRKAWFHLCMSRVLFVAKHSWTTFKFKFIKKNWENTKYDVPLLAVSYSYSRRAVAWH